MNEKPAASVRFLALDSLRGICAAIVVLFHVEVLGKVYAGHLHGLGIIDHGFLFVDFFFVLSGFIIAHGYYRKIGQWRDTLPFMIKRFGRVYPMHLLMLLCFLGLELTKLYSIRHGMTADRAPFTGPYSLTGFAASLFLVQSLGFFHLDYWNAPSWSISVEFWTYLLFALFALYFSRQRKRWAASAAALICLLCLLVVLFRSPRYIDATYDYAMFRCVMGFFSGFLVYLAFDRFLSRRRPTFPVLSLLEIAACTLAAVFVARVGYQRSSLAAPFLFSLCVAVFVWDDGVISRLLRLPPFQFLGKVSYTVYISHAFFIILAARVMNILAQKHRFGIIPLRASAEQPVMFHTGSIWISDLLVVLLVVCVFATSALLFRLIEDPARRFFNARSRAVAGRLNPARRRTAQ